MTSLPNQSLFLSKTFSDVTFIVENESIPAHKMLLAANSPYFETMLFGATNESKMSSIELNNVSYRAFVEVLRCVYLREVHIFGWTPEEVKNLVQKADEYQFHDLGYLIAESLNIDSQVTIDIIDDVVGVATRLNCNRLMEKCAEAARKWTELLFSNCEAFDKLPRDLIAYLIDNKVWNSADARLVYSIGNWRKTAPIEDKQSLLSKIDWKSLPGKYSEPLVRMFLENDVDGLQAKDWTEDFKKSDIIDFIAGVYFSTDEHFCNSQSDCVAFLKKSYLYLTAEKSSGCLILFFREPVRNVTKMKLNYNGKATITLKLRECYKVREIIGTKTGNQWEFDLALCGSFSSAALQIKDPNLHYNNRFSTNYIENITFCYD